MFYIPPIVALGAYAWPFHRSLFESTCGNTSKMDFEGQQVEAQLI